MPKITRIEIKTEQELILEDLPQVTALAFKFIQFVAVVPNQRGREQTSLDFNSPCGASF